MSSSVAARLSGRSREAMTTLANGARALNACLSRTHVGAAAGEPGAVRGPGRRSSDARCASTAAPSSRRAASVAASTLTPESGTASSTTPRGSECSRTSTRARRYREASSGGPVSVSSGPASSSSRSWIGSKPADSAGRPASRLRDERSDVVRPAGPRFTCSTRLPLAHALACNKLTTGGRQSTIHGPSGAANSYEPRTGLV